MAIIAKIKRLWKEWVFEANVDPDSPKGFRHRAEKIEAEFGKDNPLASAYRKIADIKEQEDKKVFDKTGHKTILLSDSHWLGYLISFTIIVILVVLTLLEVV